MNPYIKRKIIKKQGAISENIEDYIAVEKRLRVTINGKNIISLYCTPLMIKELVIGFLYNEGILVNRISPEHIKIAYGDEINVDINAADEVLSEELATSRYLGGISFNKKRDFGKVKDNFRIAVDAIKNIFVEFQGKSEFFKLTGCFHSAALSDGKRFLFFAEDIGRHNVVDKLTGYSIMEDIPLKEKMVLVSC